MKDSVKTKTKNIRRDVGIFNLNDVEDISDFCKKNLNRPKENYTSKILALFEIKGQLSIDEIVVGLYRLHKMEKTKSWIANTLHGMKNRALVRQVNTYIWELCKD